MTDEKQAKITYTAEEKDRWKSGLDSSSRPVAMTAT